MEAYIDDMVVKSKKKADHVQHLRDVFDVLRRYGMKLNSTKCSFGVSSGQFLGHVVNLRGIEASPAQADALTKNAEPTTIKENLPVLSAPESGEKLFLYLGVSSIVTSGVLIHYAEGKQYPVFYVSKTMTEAERRYSKAERTPEGTALSQALRLEFAATNNEAEYEALLTGIKLAKELKVRNLNVFSDSQLIIRQVREARQILRAIHEGVCGNHSGGRSLAHKAMAQGYFWPNMSRDSEELSRRCDKCQRFEPLIHQPLKDLHVMVISWPFAQWGMDVVGPLPTARAQTSMCYWYRLLD
ncbi:uncharacterized protein LOC132313803 [Cornus florida]|uniref:uncharacterized protein LOC132313803 n=1 Tax=Cornus florida TaxID=4283 RepID=UPI0028A04B5F|nr:uncharacterized protein LOC132313803 [Cornus florida]